MPDNLTVGGSLDLRGTQIQNENVRRLQDGDYVKGRYLYVDGILTHIKGKRQVGKYTLYIGKIKGRNVVSDGQHYAHCDKIRDGIADLLFKTAADRGAEQYRGLSLDTVMTVDDLVTMYRIITGARRQGSKAFVDSVKDLHKSYTIREAIEMTRGQYGAKAFAEFFEAE